MHELKTNGKELSTKVIKDITDKQSIIEQSLHALKIKLNSKVVNIVSVGRLVKEKGLNLAVESCTLLVQKNYKINWYVIGEGSERKNLQKLIMKNNLQNSFYLLGADANPYPYMKACDIYVQTSLFEGLGLTVIEASYLNKPIVSTNFPTVYDILQDQETGLIAKMNAQSIAENIQHFIDDAQLRERLVYNLESRENDHKEETLNKIETLLNI